MGSSALTIASPAFADGDTIPDQYTCRGANSSPPLVITGTPAGTACLALIMHDPDAPGGDFLHWSLWNIGPGLGSLPAGTVPDGALQGKNDFGTTRYGGPCPPSGTHRYIFMLFALDAILDLPDGASKYQLLRTIDDHTVAQATLTGLCSANRIKQSG
jgi:Raf kinase inhibitor-like YbhB/YbcL family protein